MSDEAALMEPCEPCEGKGLVAVPALVYKSAFGTIHSWPKIVTCPICHGSGIAP